MSVGFIRFIRFLSALDWVGLGAGVLRRTGMGEFVEFIGAWRSLSGYFL